MNKLVTLAAVGLCIAGTLNAKNPKKTKKKILCLLQ